MSTIVHVSNLHKYFGDFHALQGVNFEVHRGDVFGFLGPNGAGKSTTMRCMLGLIHPNQGKIELFGKDIHSNKVEVLGRIGNIIEKPDFYKYLSAETNLNIFARMANTTISQKKIHEILDFVGLLDRRKDKVKGYSHGMRQRLGIAQTLLADPELIVLDEPTTGLDPQGIIDIRNLITRLKVEKGKTIILSSHQLQEVELIANRMVIINKGKAVVEGEVKDLLNAQQWVVRMQTSDNDALIQMLRSSFSIEATQEYVSECVQFHIDRNDVPQVLRACSATSIDVYQVESKKQLEDYFIQMTKNESI
jgi:ABC-type multidrug transport system ATPase subunit